MCYLEKAPLDLICVGRSESGVAKILMVSHARMHAISGLCTDHQVPLHTYYGPGKLSPQKVSLAHRDLTGRLLKEASACFLLTFRPSIGARPRLPRTNVDFVHCIPNGACGATAARRARKVFHYAAGTHTGYQKADICCKPSRQNAAAAPLTPTTRLQYRRPPSRSLESACLCRNIALL